MDDWSQALGRRDRGQGAAPARLPEVAAARERFGTGTQPRTDVGWPGVVTWRDFIASVVDSLAWPMSIAFVVLLLRTQIGALLEAPVKRWKAGPVEVEYWEKAVEVAGAVAVAVDGLPPPVEISAEVERTRRLAETVPTVAVVKAFGIVERRLREMAGTDGGEVPEELAAPALASGLRQRGLITPESDSAVRGLAALRNLAAHDDGSGLAVSVAKAREYLTLVDGVLYALSRAPSKPE